MLGLVGGLWGPAFSAREPGQQPWGSQPAALSGARPDQAAGRREPRGLPDLGRGAPPEGPGQQTNPDVDRAPRAARGRCAGGTRAGPRAARGPHGGKAAGRGSL